MSGLIHVTGDIIIELAEILKERNLERTLAVAPTELFTVVLGQNSGSTGYLWTEKISDPKMIEQISHETIPGTGPGVPGYDRWEFKSLQTGTATILFVYSRSWEHDPADRYTVRVTVTTA